jgi:Fe-S-cluster containining protein
MARKASKTKDEKKNKLGKGGGKSVKDKVTEESEKNKPPKFKFVCQKCGVCCETEKILITLSDLERWLSDNTIYRVMHLLQMVEDNGSYLIVLKKDDDGFCNLYHRDDKTCTIYETRPLSCQAFPLGYNGEHYVLRSNECIGLGQDGITKEQLKSIREAAYDGFNGLGQTKGLLPLLYGIIFNKLIEDSKVFMDKIKESGNEEDLQKIVEDFKTAQSDEEIDDIENTDDPIEDVDEEN